MKTFFIHAKLNTDLTIPEKELGEVKQQLAKAGKTVFLAGQILGCRAESAAKFEDRVDAFLYVGSGEFHPLKVAMQTQKHVFCWNPKTRGMSVVSEKTKQEYADFNLRQLNRFYHAKRVGILISTKTGQSDNKINAFSVELKMKKALQLKARKDKEYFLFAFDTLSMYELENFPFIDCWVNTACSRIADEKLNIINIDTIFAHEASA